ncbi:MAG: HNH endonuclease [Verrucomicrobiaceae bacterium]|nr:HNH endonuclease [Verrucomicrobiaceae bacterium]
MTVSASIRRLVTQRAGNHCEYCCLSQTGQEALFHVDHILPEMDGGLTVMENLALACVSCSLRKGARQLAPDPQTGRLAALFHPRKQRWSAHFRWQGFRVVGTSATGRASVEALKLNRAVILAIRSEEAFFGRFPPPEHE